MVLTMPTALQQRSSRERERGHRPAALLLVVEAAVVAPVTGAAAMTTIKGVPCRGEVQQHPPRRTLVVETLLLLLRLPRLRVGEIPRHPLLPKAAAPHLLLSAFLLCSPMHFQTTSILERTVLLVWRLSSTAVAAEALLGMTRHCRRPCLPPPRPLKSRGIPIALERGVQLSLAQPTRAVVATASVREGQQLPILSEGAASHNS